MNGLEITMELLHFGIFSLVQQPHFVFDDGQGIAPRRKKKKPYVLTYGKG